MKTNPRGISITCLGLGLVFLSVPATSLAQTACSPVAWDQVVELARTARNLADAQEYDKALAQLREAYRICPDGKLQRAIARVQEDAGMVQEAREAYAKCHETAVEQEIRADCLQRGKALAALTEKGTLIVDASPPEAGGEVRLDAVLQAFPPAETLDEPAQPAVVARTSDRPSAAWNWVGIGAGTAVTGAGIAFLVQYGIDKGNAKGAEYAPDGSLLAEADTVSSRNVIIGSVLSAVGVAGIITSAVLWPKAPAKMSISPLQGGGAIALEFPL